MRGNGRCGTSSSIPKASAIASPYCAFTAAMPATMSSSWSSMTSSCESIQLNSQSTLVNSVAWRLVKLGSARKAGPTSKMPPKPAGWAICLKNWGLWARKASVSKYSRRKSSAFDSLALAMSFGVCSSMKPRSSHT